MQNLDEYSITDAVLQSQADTPNPRTREIFDGLVTHLHAFAREVSLTEDEWLSAIRFLTAVGHKTDDKRQEFILLSDTLGLSMLVTAMANRKPKECTESTVLGPFFVTDAPAVPNGGDVAQGAPGELCFVSGHVRGLHGEPVAGARMEVWQADEDGLYDVQYENLEAPRARGVLFSEPDGAFRFTSIVPRPYPVPHDGPVGDMLKALGRHAWRPAHLHFMIFAEGYEPLVTHVFRKNDPYLQSDAVFGVRSSLIGDWTTHAHGVAPDGSMHETPFTTFAFDFVLAPVRA
ncbi:catechol 1,2-dioxygenase [Caballeronia udeis]|uniref:Catechol 1,2-dioxygenase n=1 Tax=Caballeronia udeis TaxID=1232866 RepID=A0A158GY97_9BURK|nr:intradiol ring-cleavage dioxygenase [Caballeronia udeis]SAL37036.1 catechol 1,2-dioxygenase [Caballeronia udeis]